MVVKLGLETKQKEKISKIRAPDTKKLFKACQGYAGETKNDYTWELYNKWKMIRL
jgi:hypothetical protein